MKKIIRVFLISLLFIGISAAYLYYKDLNTDLVLNGDTDIILEYGEAYTELNANLIYKNKVLKKVETTDRIDKNKLSKYKLTYTHKGLFSTKTVSRYVEIKDTIEPTICLIGESEITLKLNEKYNEEGVQASDNYDGDLSDKVIISGDVNTDKPGTYALIYEVSDSSSNIYKVERTIKVYQPVIEKPIEKPNTNVSTPTKGGVIFLTFDDGPNEPNTSKILDILKEENVKATFFVTGEGPDYLIQRAYNEGHAIGLHTYTHIYADVYASVENYYNDLNKISDRVERLIGLKSKIIRFPGGSSNTVSRNYSKGIMSFLVKDVKDKGYEYFDWNVDSNDASTNTSANEVYTNTISTLYKTRNNIVLFHDNKTSTANALTDIIKYAKNNGYTFDVITKDGPVVHHNVSN